jgi:DNA-binding HxlR family transcriptional regulator
LEMNGIISRTVYNTIPVKVEYELTPSGESFKCVMDTMINWGLEHREKMIQKNKTEDLLTSVFSS